MKIKCLMLITILGNVMNGMDSEWCSDKDVTGPDQEIRASQNDIFALLAQAIGKLDHEAFTLNLPRLDSKNLVNERGETLLHLAAKSENADLFSALISKGIPLDEPDKKGNTPLHLCAKRKNCEALLQELIHSGVAIDAVNCKKKTALHCAASRGNDAAVRRLMQANASFIAQDETDSTPLHYAVRYCSENTIKLLTVQFTPEEKRALDMIDNNGRTPLHTAVIENRPEIVEILLSRKVQQEPKDFFGCTPYLYAHDAATAQLLVKYGADITALDREGRSLFQRLFLKEPQTTKDKLLDDQASIMREISLSTSEENDEACKDSALVNAEVLKLIYAFTQIGIPIDLQDGEGRSILHHAALKEDSVLIEELLALGAHIEHTDKRGNTVLHSAALGGREKIIRFLVRRGADLFSRNQAGETPLHCAALTGNRGVALELILAPYELCVFTNAESEKKILALLSVANFFRNKAREKNGVQKEGQEYTAENLLYKIYTSDPCYNDELARLLVHSIKKRVSARSGVIIICNNTAWRLKIRFIKNKQKEEIIIVPGEKIIIENLNVLESLVAKTYYGRKTGKVGNLFQLRGYDLLREINKELLRGEQHDIIIRMRGSDGSLGKLVVPFGVECQLSSVKDYEPHSLIPASLVLRDAFPAVGLKIASGIDAKKIWARTLLALPRDFQVDDIKPAYERISSLWKKHYFLFGEHRNYIDAVLSVLRQAYKTLVSNPESQCELSCEGLNEKIEPVNFLWRDPYPVIAQAVTDCRLFSRELIMQCFVKRGVMTLFKLLETRDNGNRTPYHCALNNNHSDLALALANEYQELSSFNVGRAMVAEFFTLKERTSEDGK